MRRLRLGEAVLEVMRDAPAVAARGAEIFKEISQRAVEERSRFMVALAGGSTPRALYTLLASEHYLSRVPWQATHVFWGDERCVPPESEESNYRMAYDALLGLVPVPREQVHRMRGEDEPERAADDYARVLETEFREPTPRFDLVLLGMGEDGHTASLFPRSGALDETEHLVVAPFVEKLAAHRLTMTFRVINAAAHVAFLVAGASKAATLRAVLKGEQDEPELPARMVRPANGELLWLVDEAAAALL